MKINSISLENFRNISSLSLKFEDTNIIWGENAQGKTNLIEAIYLFTGAHSFRSVKDRELIKLGEEKSKLNIEFFSNDRVQNAEIEIAQRKKAWLNGVAKKSAVSFGDEIKAIIFSPVHLTMIKDGPNERRKFIDNALCQLKSNYASLLKSYNRLLMQRNAVLKKSESLEQAEVFLNLWDEALAKTGAKIIYQRLKYIEAIKPYIIDIFDGLSSGTEKIDLKYIGADEYKADIEDIEKKLLVEIISHHKADFFNQTSTKGPHRDDIEILINNNSARIYASQGQQRSCVLALKLAEAALLKQMTGIQPIALLDDVMSELDEKRQDYILNHIKDCQVFITCCDKETVLKLKNGKTFHIKNGNLDDTI